MARSGTALGTVVRWDDDRTGALIEAPDLPGGCWADAAVVVHRRSRADVLRAGQVVEVDWVEEATEGLPFRALRVTPRPELQATVGG
jgi:hypothetical protein